MPGRVLQRIDGPAGPLVVEQLGKLRQLHFDNGITQTTIDTRHPGYLPLSANRAMLAHLMFADSPQKVLLAGCGGGAIARWFHAHAPEIHGSAVENNPEVADLARRWFEFPGEDRGWQLVIDDIRDFLSADEDGRYDFILADLEEDAASPDWLISESFLANCRRHLSEHGVLTVNWIADSAERFTLALLRIRQAFGQRTLCLPVPQHENVMILAFKQRPSLDGMEERIRQASQTWGLEFETFYRRMLRNNPPGSGVF